MMTKAEAGRLGGLKTVKRHGKRYMRKLGKWGAHVMHTNNALVPVDRNDFAIADRQTGRVKAYLSGKPMEGELYVNVSDCNPVDLYRRG